MLNKILVAIDRSVIRKEVFKQALSLAQATNANLMLLHVLSGEEEGSRIMSFYPTVYDHYIHLNPDIERTDHQLYKQQWLAFEQAGIDLLRSLAREAIAAGVNIEFSQISGSPSSTICNLAQSWHADLIVIGRRGHSGLKEMFLGSVSNYVVHHSPCFVFIVHSPIEPNTQVHSEGVASKYQA